MRFDRARWRRWTWQWLILSLWCGFVPIALTAAYYEVKKPKDFDPPLNSLRTEASSSRLLWTIRVGTASLYAANIGIRTTSFGINVEDTEAAQRAQRVWNRQLSGAYQATYLVHARGSKLPTVITTFRDVAPDGSTSYRVEERGTKPIMKYVLYVVLFSAAAVAFLNTSAAIYARRKHA